MILSYCWQRIVGFQDMCNVSVEYKRLLFIVTLLYWKWKGNRQAENWRNCRRVENWRTAGLGNIQGHPLYLTTQAEDFLSFSCWAIKHFSRSMKKHLCPYWSASFLLQQCAHCSVLCSNTANRKNQSWKQSGCWNRTNWSSTLFTGWYNPLILFSH